MPTRLARRVPIPARLLVTLGVPLVAIVGVLGAQVQAARADGAAARLGVGQARMLQAMADLQASVVQPEIAANGLTSSSLGTDLPSRLLSSAITEKVATETQAAVREYENALKTYSFVITPQALGRYENELSVLSAVLAGDNSPTQIKALLAARAAADDSLADTYLAAGNQVPWVIYQGVIELNRTTTAEFSAILTTSAGRGRISAGQMAALSAQRASSVNRSRFGVDATTRAKIDAIVRSEEYTSYERAAQNAVAVASGRAQPVTPLTLAPLATKGNALRLRMRAICTEVMNDLLRGQQRRLVAAKADQRRSLVIAGSTVLVTLLLAAAALRSITGPLHRLTKRAGELAAGRLDGEPVPVVGSDELARLTIALEGAASTLLHVNAQALAMAEGRLDDPSLARPAPGPLGEVLHENVSAVKASASRLRHAADHDGLTGLLNRAGLENAMDAGRDYWLLYLDLDGFKEVNDVHGHDQGDDVLRSVSERLLRVLGTDDLVCRLGGDEFVVLQGVEAIRPGPGEEGYGSDDLGKLGDLQEAEDTQGRIEAAIRRPIQIRSAQRQASGDDVTVDHVQVGVSIGRARMAVGGSLDVALAEADAGMYRAKRDGKARRAVRPHLTPAPGVPAGAGERRL